jgi:hypothetical protein
MAAVTAAVVGAGAAVASGVRAGKESKKGRRAARDSAAADREFNYRMFQEGRGSEGSAKLPVYMKDSRGRLIEPIAGTQAADIFSIPLDRTPQERFDEYKDIYEKEEPLRQQGLDTLRGIYEGVGGISDYERRRQANLAPITEAEQAQARTIGQSAEFALAQQLNQQRARDAMAGISGRANLGQQLAGAAIRQNAANQQANAIAAANLSEAQRTSGVAEDAYKMQLDNPQLADSIAAMQIASQQQPYNQLVEESKRQYSALQPFEISPSTFRAAPLPAPGVDTSGSALLGGISGAANVAGQYARNKQMMDLLNTQQFIRQPTYYGADAAGAAIPATAGEVGAGFDFNSI